MDNYNNRILSTLEKFAAKLFKDPNVIAFGLGNKIINGYMLNIPTFSILVDKKINFNDINYYNRIPPQINGILTDVIQAGHPLKTYNTPNIITNELPKITLPTCGSGSIRNVNSEDLFGGSIAHMVMDIEKKLYILSTADVLTKDENIKVESGSNDSIIFPGNVNLLKYFTPPVGVEKKPIEIAKLFKVFPVRHFDTNEKEDDPANYNPINAGLASIVKPSHVVSGVGPKKQPLKKIKTVEKSDSVFKYSTIIPPTNDKESIPVIGSKVKGTVILTNSFVSIQLNTKKKYPFRDQIVVDMPYYEGDNGTLGLVKSAAKFDNDDSVFGMCSGGSSKRGLTFFTPISEITSRLKVAFTDLAK